MAFARHALRDQLREQVQRRSGALARVHFQRAPPVPLGPETVGIPRQEGSRITGAFLVLVEWSAKVREKYSCVRKKKTVANANFYYDHILP